MDFLHYCFICLTFFTIYLPFFPTYLAFFSPLVWPLSPLVWPFLHHLFVLSFTILPLVRPLLLIKPLFTVVPSFLRCCLSYLAPPFFLSFLITFSFSLISFFLFLFSFSFSSSLFGLLLLNPTYFPFYCCPSCLPHLFLWPFLLLLLLFGLFSYSSISISFKSCYLINSPLKSNPYSLVFKKLLSY